MFEQEAEEYTMKNICKNCTYRCYTENILKPNKLDCFSYAREYKIFKDGAEFGYNKANEWHYLSKGEYPPLGTDVLICIKLLNNDKVVKIGSFQQGGGILIEGFICSVNAAVAWQALRELPTGG